MSRVDCPHCGERNFRLLPTRKIDRCASCGRAIATTEPVRVEDKVREAIGNRRRMTEAPIVRRPRSR